MPGAGGKKENTTQPPDAVLVYRRARILAARAAHAFAWPLPDVLAETMRDWFEGERKQFTRKFDENARAIRLSLETRGLWDYVAPEERKYFTSRLADRTQRQAIASMWAVESVACCLWALGVLPELPPYDQGSDQEVLNGMPAEGESPALRSREELERERSIAELWHWRSRTRRVAESGKAVDQLPGGLTLDEVVRKIAASTAAEGEIPDTIDGDFPAFSKAYRDLTRREYAHVTSIAIERHKAFNWICGYAPENQWDLTPTDT